MIPSDASFGKRTLLQVFTSVAIYVAVYITAKYCSNKAISSIFHFFTAQMQVSQKNFCKKFRTVIEGILLLPNIDKVASQALKT